MRWPHSVDWKTGPFTIKNPHRNSIIDIMDLVVDEFSLGAFSLSVSGVWDWDLPVGRVGMSRQAAVEAWRIFGSRTDSTRSLEELVWEGWWLPASWIRCGVDVPHAFLGGVPVSVALDDEVEAAGLAWLVRGERPLAGLVHGDEPTEPCAYRRVLWIGEPVGVPLNPERLVDPGMERLKVILADRAKQQGVV